MANERRRRQVARQIQERIATLLLYEMKDPRRSFVTVTSVELNSDLSVATVRWSVVDSSERRRVEGMIRHAHGFLRTEIAHAVKLRNAPQLVFRYDEGLERAQRIEEILAEVLPPENDSDEEADPDGGD